MIGSFAVGAMMVGSTTAGPLMRIGRRKVINIAAIIGIIGILFTEWRALGTILVGRLFYGFATGLIAVAMPRYMDEVLPPKLMGIYGGLYCFSFAIATIIAYLLALGLPPDKDKNGNANTEKLKED